MIPASTQRQPPLPTSPASPNLTTPPASPFLPRSRLLLWLVGGFTLLVIIISISVKMFEAFLKQKQLMSSQQNQIDTNYLKPYISHVLDLSLELPPEFEALETKSELKNSLTITNNLKVKYFSLIPDVEEIPNYQLIIIVKSGSFAEISQDVPIDTTITIGPHTFQSGIIGAEDEGEKYYFLKTPTDDWLTVIQSVRDESRIPETDKTKDGYLNNDQQQNYTEQILSGLRFIKL